MTYFHSISLRISLAIMLTVLNGCVPHVAEYRYISLENLNDAIVVEQGKADLKNLSSHDSMPIRYRVRRNSYILDLYLDKESYLPAMIVSASSLKQVPLVVEFNLDPALTGCASYKRIIQDDPNRLRFTWLGCNGIDDPLKQKISVRVLDTAKHVLGEESMPFELRKNGTYVVQDAI